MKILHICTSDSGGAGGATVRTHQHLLNKGQHSQLLVLHKSKHDVQNIYSFSEWEKQKTAKSLVKRMYFSMKPRILNYLNRLKIKSLPKGYELFSFPQTAYKVESHPLVKEADIIVLHWVAGFVNFKSFFPAVHKPIVWRLPDMFPFTGGYHYEIGFPIEAYHNVIKTNLAVKSLALQHSFVYLVPLCNWMSDQLNKSIFHRFPKTIIPNGINTELFQPRESTFCRDLFSLPFFKKVILFVADSVHNARKGFSLLHEALKILNLPDLHLAVIGSHSENLADLPQLTVLGRIQDDRLLALAYAAADLFVIPSIEDNLPNTVIESLACGTPVAGFAIGGIPDMVQDGQNGFLSSEVSAAGLAEVIRRALAHPFDRKAIREDAVARFDQSVQATRYIELFKTLHPTTGETNA